MKFLICVAVLVMVGCGVVPQAQLEPVGGTRDLVSTEQRLYVQKVSDDEYCVLLEDKRDKSTALLTDHGALSAKELEKLLRNRTYWQVFWQFTWFYPGSEVMLRTNRLAALQVRDAKLAVPQKQFDKIVARIRIAKPENFSRQCDKLNPVLNR